MATTDLPSHLNPSAWLSTLTTPASIKENHCHYWGNDHSTLLTTSHPLTFSLGTGLSIHQNTLLPALEAAEQEVLLVTCFWAPSASLSLLRSSLLLLSRKALSRKDDSKIRVRIGFSSRSLLQMLFHTSSPAGYVYRPEEWETKLGLPPPEQLEGLDLEVRSKFCRPFSVMHPKFMVVDRQKAFMPSCNVSWETWCECCIGLEGPVVSNLVEFWKHFWGQGKLPALPRLPSHSSTANGELPNSTPTPSTSLQPTIPLPSHPLTTLLLPSPHHTPLSISIPFPFIHPPPPPTPLNTLLLHLFSTATTSINILTPNLTSPPVITALLTALARGVDISIITNRRMMLLEQLVTAGTVTEFCVWAMVRKYTRLVKRASGGRGGRGGRRRGEGELARMEEGRAGERGGVGRLEIGYYRPRPHGLQRARANTRDGHEVEPGKSHVKCTVIDGQVVVLGSGNMDRASWFTSQELGIALYGEEIVDVVWGRFQEALEGRVEGYFGGGG